mmetsp:Transcript_32004/g.90827  ORF Transcript_32004/g.90827 Transcript_32004/m.90827 type:complete len:404 (-) Transcript_32004:248-1459(-)
MASQASTVRAKSVTAATEIRGSAGVRRCANARVQAIAGVQKRRQLRLTTLQDLNKPLPWPSRPTPVWSQGPGSTSPRPSFCPPHSCSHEAPSWMGLGITDRRAWGYFAPRMRVAAASQGRHAAALRILRKGPTRCSSCGRQYTCPAVVPNSCGMANSHRMACRSASDRQDVASPTPVGPLDALRQSYPFFTDPLLLSEDIVYSGPLQELKGREKYLNAMQAWRENLPARLAEFQVTNANLYQVQPGSVQGKCSFSFVAPLPPGSRDRGLPEDMEVLPGDKGRVSTSLRSDITLDAKGRITSHTEIITDGYDVPGTISRYEFLTARNLGEPGPAWYWKVLRSTTIEEQDVFAGGQMSKQELEDSFRNMVTRNFTTGLLLGAVMYGLLKALQLYTYYHANSGPSW